MVAKILLSISALSYLIFFGRAFSPVAVQQQMLQQVQGVSKFVAPGKTYDRSVSLHATGGKKRRRRRKQPPVEASESVPESTMSVDDPAVDGLKDFDADAEEEEEEVDIDLLKDVAKFKFEGEIAVPEQTPEVSSKSPENTAIPLPNIRDTLRNKEIEQEMERIEEEEAERTKIKRSDKKAFSKLLEQDPYADADDSFFEEEEYGTVSALLGERALPFLGIPTGPLQVGHFIGALVIVLMAFVEYPGFPLTNLPSPLRGALQGGLLTVYTVNAILAGLAVFKAGERGQPALLWVMKTFTVGGLAYDQLTQLPTLAKIEEIKARKGKRALKSRRK